MWNEDPLSVKKIVLALHLLIPFSYKTRIIHVFNVDKNGGKIWVFRFLQKVLKLTFPKVYFFTSSKKPLSPIIENPKIAAIFCRSENRPHKSHNISGYLYRESNGKYWFVVHAGGICLSTFKVYRPPQGPKARLLQNNSNVFSLNLSFCKTFWENGYNKLSSILLQINILMVWFVVYVERGPFKRKKNFLALRLLIPFSTKSVPFMYWM